MARRDKEDDSDNDMDSATERAARELEAQAKEERQGKRKDSDDPVVDLDEEPDDDEEVAAAPTRQERRKSRWEEMKRKAEESERKAKEAEESLSRERLRAESLAELARMRQQETPREDPIEKEIAQAKERRARLMATYDALPEEIRRAQFEDFRKQYDEADEAVQTLVTRKVMGPQQQQKSPAQVVMETMYPDIASHPRGPSLARAHYDLLVQRGAPHSHETLHKSLEEARKELRTGPAARPARDTSSLRDKLSYSPGRGGNGGPPREAPRQVELTKGDRAIARARYPKLSEKEAFRLHAQTKAKSMADD